MITWSYRCLILKYWSAHVCIWTFKQKLKRNQGQSLPVLMPGDQVPKFIAMACPCEPPRTEKITVQIQKPPSFPVPFYWLMTSQYCAIILCVCVYIYNRQTRMYHLISSNFLFFGYSSYLKSCTNKCWHVFEMVFTFGLKRVNWQINATKVTKILN